MDTVALSHSLTLTHSLTHLLMGHLALFLPCADQNSLVHFPVREAL